MVTRILSAVVLAPLFFVVLFFLPPVFLAVLLACITARASFELLRATKVAHHNGMYVYTAAAAGLIPLTFWLGWGNWSLAALSLLLMAALFLGAIRRFDSGSAISLEDLLVCMFGGIVIPAFLSTLVLLKGMESGRYLVLLPVISAFLTDAGAYFVGVFFGKHKGITRVSPNKSLEGYPISCCGSPPMRSSTLRMCCGRISAKQSCCGPSPAIRAGPGDLEVFEKW